MVLEWLSGDSGSVDELIAKKKYKKAIEVLRTEFQKGSREPRLRQQLADVLVLAGRGREAVPILAGLADELARTGYAAKAIAVLKRIDKIDPGRADVARKLAGLIEAKPPERAEAPQDFREIGVSLPPRAPAPAPSWPPPPSARTEEEPLVPGAPLPVAVSAAAAPRAMEPEAIEVEPELIDDLDLSLETLVPTEAVTGDIVRSPLFSDFSSAELLAVIGGLRLLTFEAGDIVITEGEPGDSLFVLTTGRVKAFVRNPAGRHVQVREMEEGEFFGEISILTGKPRTATVTAASRLELLELDRATLDAMTPGHPGVVKILPAFCHARAGSADEALVRGMAFGSARDA
ncbi:MAG TPA: cyclic nucleotide-binding domain-containing protein, partial [Vicinamibacteria bacterium]|nr:cyclic nucleotide-binding domain-containing protein [Vicinamibacteria bacterium]